MLLYISLISENIINKNKKQNGKYKILKYIKNGILKRSNKVLIIKVIKIGIIALKNNFNNEINIFLNFKLKRSINAFNKRKILTGIKVIIPANTKPESPKK